MISMTWYATRSFDNGPGEHATCTGRYSSFSATGDAVYTQRRAITIPRRIPHALVLLVLCLACSRTVFAGDESSSDDAVAGPVVRLADIQGPSAPAVVGNATDSEERQGGIEQIAAAVQETAKEVAREVDKTLIEEFGNGTKDDGSESAYAAAMGAQNTTGGGGDDISIETVVRITGPTGGAGSSGGSGSAGTSSIIDQNDNKFILSKPHGEGLLTIDPQLILDVTVIMTAAAILGAFFEAVRQPTIIGYLLAGAIVGPGGLQLVKELVQVESVAQLGVFLLLFGLGMELNPAKIKKVLGVSVLGGSLQIIVAMCIGGAVSAGICDAPVSAGAFTGALLAMSSTSVLVKCLESTRSLTSSYGTVTVGTLILQDCWVGLLFALLPVFKPFASEVATAVVGRLPSGTGAAAGGGDLTDGSGSMASDADAGMAESAEHAALIAGAVLKVLLKIVLLGSSSLLLARVVLSHLLRLLVRHGSTELNQVVMVGFCLLCTWVGGRAGISEELGAFIGGIMVSSAAAGMVAAAAPKPGRGPHDPHDSSDVEEASALLPVSGLDGAAELPPTAAGGGVGGGASGGGAPTVEELQHALRRRIDSVHNVLTTLFLASTALIISPRFLLQHVKVLAISTALVMAVKALLVTATVAMFGYPWKMSLAVGATMAHVGEFAFVLLSAAAEFSILPPQVYQLLLGVTALSLLATPLVVMVCSSMLRDVPPAPPLLSSAAVHVPRAAGAPKSPVIQGLSSLPDFVQVHSASDEDVRKKKKTDKKATS